MRLPKRTTFALLLFLLCLNYLVRYPRTPHELGYDAFVFHGMTLSLTEAGYAKWIIHPLSYLGLYPLSHPSGSMFTLGAFSLTSGLPIEGAILLFDMVVVLAGLLISFVLAMEIRRDEVLALLVAALFSLAPRYVTSLLWEVPTRTLFTTLVPLVVWVLLRWHRSKDLRFLALAPVTLFLMMSAHRLTFLMSILLIAFVLTALILVTAQTLRIRYASQLLSPAFRRATNVGVILSIIIVASTLLVLGGVLASYQTGQLGLGSGILSQVSNLGVSLTRSAGFLIPLLPLGALAVYNMRAKGLKEAFLLMILVVLIPTLSLRQYTGYYIVPFTALFIGLGLWYIVGRLRRRVTRVAVAAAALAVSIISVQVVVGFDLQSEPYIDDQSYAHAVYILHTTDGTIVANDGVLGSKIYAIAGAAYLPVGGATTAFQSPEVLIFGFVDPNSLRIVQIPIAELTIESDSPFVLLGVQAERDWAEMLDRPLESTSSRVLRVYDPTYLLELRATDGGYFAYGRRYDSPFISSVHSSSYKVFEIQGQALWYLR